MLGVRHQGVHDEGVHETEKSLLYTRERKEMATNKDGVFNGENGVRGVRFHDPV
jgi:hypothetical protein